MARTDDIQKLIANHERRRQKLLETQALQGYGADPAVLNEIEDIDAKLAELRAELARLRAETPAIDPRLLRGHYFISYAPTDGAGVAAALHRALAEAGVPAWLDQQQLDPAAPPERQINQALQTCAGLLLLVSADSGDPAAGSSREWAQALSYKRPLLLLRLEPAADIPYRLTGYPVIELSAAAVRGEGEAFTAAVAQVRQQLAGLDTPAGQRQQVWARLATAHADLRLARDAQRRQRIQADIADLKKELAVIERIAANPAAAVERTRQSIAAGIEGERQPAERPARLARRKFINPPPLDVPGYFQDRFDETRRLSAFLTAPELRLLTVVGRGGIGKTTLVARLLKHLERGELPDGIGRLAVDGIVYLSDVGARPLTFPNLFSDVSQLLPDEAARALDAIYREPQTSVADKMAALLRHFPRRSDDGSEGRPVIVLLDNFETRLDPADYRPTDADLDEALHALLTLPSHRLKVIITSRVAPRDLLLAQPHYQQPLYLDEGLVSPYAETLLRVRDPDGKLGLKTATDAELAPAITYTRGYPRALEALTAALAADRDTDLVELLAAAETALPDNVVEVLVGEAYSRLAPAAQQVLQVLAVYGRPVPLTAIDYLLEPYRPDVDSGPTLKRLVNMNFVSKEGGLYYLHPVDRAHALSHIPQGHVPSPQPSLRGRGGEQIPLPQGGVRGGQTDGTDDDESPLLPTPYSHLPLLRRAADYFKTTRKPRTEWRCLPDLAPQMAEFDLRCEADDFDAAARVLREIDFDYLLLWGHYQLMIERHHRLQGNLEDPDLQRISAGNLGTAYRNIGQAQQAIIYYEQALASARRQKNKGAEGAWLGNLGNAYIALGESRRAINYYEQALTIAHDISDHRNEGAWLSNLGNAYAALGETGRAIDYHEQALVIARNIGDRRGEGYRLGSLGNCYTALGETGRAIDYHEQALVIARNIGDRSGEGAWLGNLGNAYIALGESRRAINYYEQALTIAHDISDHRNEGAWLSNLGNAYAALGETGRAIDYHEQALVIARNIGDRRGEGIRLGNLAERLIEVGRYDEAIERAEAFVQICSEINTPASYAYSRIALAHLYTKNLSAARAAVDAARRYNVPENNHNVVALLGLVVLRQGQVDPARAAFQEAIALVEELLGKTPQFYDALYAKGLAWSGLAVCGPAVSGGEAESGPPLTPPAGGRIDSVESIGGETLDMPIAYALDAYRAALAINSDAGVVARQRRLFEALAVADTAGVLSPVAEVWPGKEL